MIERPLLTPDELKSLPKGTFVVMKTGHHPMKVKLKLFFEWGIKFEEPYSVEEKGNRKVNYAIKDEIIEGIMLKYHADELDDEDDIPPNAMPVNLINSEIDSVNEKAEEKPSVKTKERKSPAIRTTRGEKTDD